jgi:hypothetical protein
MVFTIKVNEKTHNLDESRKVTSIGPPLLGESNNELTYILAWESLADRERKWTAFQEDPSWHKVRDDTERDGPIVATISSQILTPTPFSALK